MKSPRGLFIFCGRNICPGGAVGRFASAAGAGVLVQGVLDTTHVGSSGPLLDFESNQGFLFLA